MKDMKTIGDYNKERKLNILKGQCLNAASRVVASFQGSDVMDNKRTAQHMFDLAGDLYAEALKRDWMGVE